MKRNLFLMVVLCVGIFLLMMSLRPAPGADIRVFPDNTGTTTVTLDGKLDWWDAFNFKRQTEALTGKVIVVLNSPGGHIDGAISIGTFIHMNQWTTRVMHKGTCASACALIWFAGVERELDDDDETRIGLHAAWRQSKPGEPIQFSGEGNERVMAYLRSFQIPEGVITYWLATDPDKMYWMYFPEAELLNLLTKYPQPKGGIEKAKDESFEEWVARRKRAFVEQSMRRNSRTATEQQLMNPGPPLGDMLKPGQLSTHPPR